MNNFCIKLKRIFSIVISLIIGLTLLTACNSAPELETLTLSIEHPTGAFDINQEIQFEITAEPDSLEINNLELQYTSTDPSVVSFDSEGLSTLSEGQSSIYVTSSDDGIVSNIIFIEVEDKERIAKEQENQDAAEEIAGLIHAIGDVSLASEEDIAAARNAYDKASDDIKELVTNFSTLVASETKYQELVRLEEQRIQEEAQRAQQSQSSNNATGNNNSSSGGSGATQPPSQPESTGGPYYYTRTGSKYHSLNPCGNGTYFPCTLEEALQRGLEPCAKCIG